jgi:hypothetical protein
MPNCEAGSVWSALGVSSAGATGPASRRVLIVTDATGRGVPGVTVSAYGPGDTWVGLYGTRTVADGSYRIAGVRVADYRVRVVPPAPSGLAIEWYDNAPTAASAKTVAVTSGTTTTGIDAQLGASP